jgi:hypothetical protein
MQDFFAVLRIDGPAKYHNSIVTCFGKEACSCHQAGDPFEQESSFLPIKNWPTDVVLVTPRVESRSSIVEYVAWCCDQLIMNNALMQKLIADGVTMDISCWCHSSEKVGDFRLSSDQIKILANYGISVFFRFVVDEVFAETRK